jgi:2-iminobutanoate/2-iminopropanoate deaminase
MTRRRIATNAAPAAIGPYSQGIAAGEFVFCAGQVGLDPTSGELVEGGIEREAERALDNLRAVLEAAAMTTADVVKTTVFLADFGDFAALNEVYARYFPDPPPARSTFQVAALPKGARVEIEAIAHRARPVDAVAQGAR